MTIIGKKIAARGRAGVFAMSALALCGASDAAHLDPSLVMKVP